MHLVNGSQFKMGAEQVVDQHGRVHLLSVTKGPCDIPDDLSQAPQPFKLQVPIFDTDVFQQNGCQLLPDYWEVAVWVTFWTVR